MAIQLLLLQPYGGPSATEVRSRIRGGLLEAAAALIQLGGAAAGLEAAAAALQLQHGCIAAAHGAG